ncbi:MAG: translocation/assembly module TamB domain-containing protein [Blastocatellia bacterium]
MSQTPELPASGANWAARHKRIIIAGVIVLLLLLGLGLGGLYYIRSGRLNLYITNQVQAALSEYGIRAEIGALDLAWGVRTASVRDVKLYNQETGQLIAAVDRAELVVEIPNPFALRLRREVIFKRLDLDNLQAYVQTDAQGQSNFAGLHAPPPSAPSRITFDFSTLVGTLNSGTLHFNDEARRIAAELGNLKANAQPIPGSAAVDLKFATSAGRVSYEGRETTLDNIDVAAHLGDAAADIERFSLRSPLGEVTGGGRVEDYNTPRYNFNLQVRAALQEAARVFAPDTGLQGSAAFDGRVGGEAARFRVSGGLTSDEFAMSDARVRGASVDDIKIESDGQRITFAGSRATADSVAAQRNRLSGVTLSSPGGEFNAGRIQATVPLAAISRLTLPQGQLTGIALRGVNASMLEGRTQARAEQVTATRLTLPEGQVAGIALRGVAAEVGGGRYRVTAGLRINGGRMSGAQFGPAQGQLVADNSAVALHKFNASLLGGTASGDVVVQTAGGASRLTASLNGLRTNELFGLLKVNDAPLAGTLNGQLNVSWPGANFNAVSGTITAHLSGETTQTASVIPVNGDVDIRAQRGVFNINQLELATDASHLTASGLISPKGNSDLRFSLTSTRAEELQTLAYSIEGVEKAVADFKPRLAGDLRLEGQVRGPLSDPAIEADLNASSVGLRDQTIGSLSGHARFTPTEIAFENGTLATTDGGTAKFTYAAPRAAAATEGRLDATIDGINVDTLAAAAGLSSQQEIISGVISGEAHLTGLPGSPVGTAKVNLVDGKVAGQSAQVATASLIFDGRTARLDAAELRLAQGRLTATGNYDLKSNSFQLQGRADDVDLNQVASSLNATASVTGVANATFQASGNTNDLGELQVELTAQGQGVTVNGRDAGQLSLTAHTNPGGRVDVDLITGITGRPQAVRASIELRRPGRPIDVQTELTDFEIGPLVAAFAPGLASSVAGVLNGRLRVGGPILNERGEMTLERLSGNLTLDRVSLQAKGRTINIQTPLMVALNNSQVTLAQTRISGQGFDLRLGGMLGLSGGSRLGFTLNGTANLDALGQLSPDLFLGGTVAIDTRLEGTLSDPRLAGEIRLTNLSFSGVDLPVEIEAGNGRIVLAGDRITLESFTARANEGTVSANGTVTLNGFRPNDWRLAVAANNMTVLYQGAEAIVNADLALAGNPDRQVLSGTITIPEGEYTTNLDLGSLASGGSGGGSLSFGGGGGQAAGGPGAFGFPPVNLDLRIEAPNSLLIRNEQINTVGTAALTVGGTLNDPAITGRVAVEGGTIKFRSQRYDITTGTLDFPAGGATPLVNVLTEGDVSGYHVYVGLTGPIDAMEVTLRSDPDLPRSEILSLVATGRTDSSTLGSQDILASGFGTAASLLSEEFISQPAQSLLGLNRFQIDPVLEPNSNPAARLTIGKQLTRDLAFTYSTNVGSEQDQSALVEYTLSNRFSGLASYTQGGTIANGGRTDSAFTIEVRGRRRFSLGFRPTASTVPGAGGATPAPPPRARRALPPAEVTLDKPGEIKLSDRKLRELIPVETEGFSRPLARLGERNLANYLQEKGYFFATVRSRCEPADCSGPEVHLIYDVQPGQRLDLDDIRIEGTDQVSVSDVSDDLQSKEASFFGRVPFVKNLPLIGGLARGITSNDRIRRDRETIRARLADLGFRSARVTSRIDTRPQSEDMVIVFQVEEGPRSTISDVAFKGNTVLASTELRQNVAVKDGEPFSPTQAREAARQIKSTYADQGFLDATTQYTIIDVAPDRVRLEYDIAEGTRAVVSEIEITGQSKTREASIRRFLAFKPGDVLTPATIRRTQRDLFATGAFSEVNIRPEPITGNDATARRVTVQVTESKPLLMVYGLGYSTDEGPRGLLQLTDTNLFGRANSISLRTRASLREQLAQLQYTDLRVFGSEWAATVSAFFDRNSNLRTFTQRRLVGGGTAPNNGPGFGINRFVAFLQAERKFSDITSLRLRYSIENTKLFNVQNIPLEEIARNETAIRLGLFSAGLTRDSRDSALNPTRGQLASFEHSVAARPFGGNEAFNKSFANYQHYRTLPETTPLLRNTVLAFAARIGLAAPFSVRGTGPGGEITDVDRLLPISQRFFSGGATTLRGFKFEQAGPQGILEPRNADELPTLVPLGGDALVVFNFELRYPLTRQLRFVPFYDLGNVFRKVSDISFGGMTHSIGAGLRFNTPIGPVGIDYGYLLDPPMFTSASGVILRQPRGVIHIRFGQTF